MPPPYSPPPPLPLPTSSRANVETEFLARLLLFVSMNIFPGPPLLKVEGCGHFQVSCFRVGLSNLAHPLAGTQGSASYSLFRHSPVSAFAYTSCTVFSLLFFFNAFGICLTFLQAKLCIKNKLIVI